MSGDRKHTNGPWTAVFTSDLSAIGGNPFHVETPFGRAVHIGWGNAFHEAERLREQRDALLRALEGAVEGLGLVIGTLAHQGHPEDYEVMRRVTAAEAEARSALSRAREGG